MVKALHRAGLEVILDVVYNHTAEGNHLGPMLSFKGVDNAAYYRLMPEDPHFYMDFTGTGNTLNAVQPAVLRLIMDSLRYFVLECRGARSRRGSARPRPGAAEPFPAARRLSAPGRRVVARGRPRAAVSRGSGTPAVCAPGASVWREGGGCGARRPSAGPRGRDRVRDSESFPTSRLRGRSRRGRLIEILANLDSMCLASLRSSRGRAGRS